MIIMIERIQTLKKIKKDFICAEIGVWRGDFSNKILKYCPRELHLVDPWVHQDHEWVKWAKGEKVVKSYEEVLRKFNKNPKVKIHRKNSLEVFLGEEYFDWVYIDADHSYSSVIQDLIHWYDQLKIGGYLCGDDYGWTSPVTHGPKPAVDDFVVKYKLKLEIHGTQFVIQKIK